MSNFAFFLQYLQKATLFVTLRHPGKKLGWFSCLIFFADILVKMSNYSQKNHQIPKQKTFMFLPKQAF